LISKWFIIETPEMVKAGKKFFENERVKFFNDLNIACGDGFYAYYFYVSTGALVDCIDINEKAISHAKRYHSHPNILHYKLDAVTAFPRESYDVVCIDGAIDHFPNEQLQVLIHKIKVAIGTCGILTGYLTIGYHEPDDEHPICFETKEKLINIFSKYFKYVNVLVTQTSERINAYIRCSNNKGKMHRFSK